MSEFDPISFLQDLIRFDTTNPPGQEKACIEFIRSLLESNGIDCETYTMDPERPNLVARIKGSGEKQPILFYGHVDVVPANEKDWSFPPFEGQIHDGLLYGRGALDMKGGLTILIANFIRMSKEPQKHDTVLVVLNDEEIAGEHGAKYMVENYPHLFSGIKIAIGEFGGFPITLKGKRTYLIQVAEKQVCWLRLRIKNKGGHASLPIKDGVLHDLAKIILKLNGHQFTKKESPLINRIFRKLAVISDYQMNDSLPLKLEDYEAILEKLGDVPLLASMLRKVANVTMINTGLKVNMIPEEVAIEIDGRLLPGETPEDLILELSELLSVDTGQFQVTNYVENHHEDVDWTFYEFLERALSKMEPDAHVMPLLLPGSTDARYFNKLNIQTFGFLPMNFPKDFDAMNKIHGVDECIPVDSISFGIKTLAVFLDEYKEVSF